MSEASDEQVKALASAIEWLNVIRMARSVVGVRHTMRGEMPMDATAFRNLLTCIDAAAAWLDDATSPTSATQVLEPATDSTTPTDAGEREPSFVSDGSTWNGPDLSTAPARVTKQ